jgi:uncharacterized protein involved in exopolysaccharide biosynthesis
MHSTFKNFDLNPWLKRLPHFESLKDVDLKPWLKRLPYWQPIQAACVKHWRPAAAVAGGVFLVIAAVTFMLPRKYYSEGKLLVKTGGWENNIDATGSVGQTVSYFEPRENEINSILEVIRSRAVTEGVVDTLGIKALLHGGAIPKPGDMVPASDPKSTARQFAIAQLEKQMQIWVPKKSNTIILRCEANSPQLAQAIVAAYLDVYQKTHAEVNSTKGSYEFFSEQHELLRQKWNEATDELRTAKDQLGVATAAGRRTMLESQLTEVRKSLLTDESESAASRGRIESLHKQMGETPKFTETTRAESANVAADTMRGNLYTLQMKQQELLAKYTPAHPLVRDMNEQVAALENLLAKEGRTRIQSTAALNPAWSQLEGHLLSETTRLESYAAGMKQLKLQETDLLSQLRQLNDDEIRLAQLQQTADVAQRSCLETAQRLEQARLHRELAQEHISNVNVFQAPSYVSQAIAPKRSMILGLGALVSLFAGAATVAGLAWLRRGFQSVSEVSNRLKLPVVARFSPQMRIAVG